MFILEQELNHYLYQKLISMLEIHQLETLHNTNRKKTDKLFSIENLFLL